MSPDTLKTEWIGQVMETSGAGQVDASASHLMFFRYRFENTFLKRPVCYGKLLWRISSSHRDLACFTHSLHDWKGLEDGQFFIFAIKVSGGLLGTLPSYQHCGWCSSALGSCSGKTRIWKVLDIWPSSHQQDFLAVPVLRLNEASPSRAVTAAYCNDSKVRHLKKQINLSLHIRNWFQGYKLQLDL